MAKYTNIRQRQIYWLDDCEPLDGDHEKDRPVIVWDLPENLKTEAMIQVVACSTHPNRKDLAKILIPSRHLVPETGLSQDCWAIPRWYMEINRFRLKDLKGNCPKDIFANVLEAVLDQIDIDQKR